MYRFCTPRTILIHRQTEQGGRCNVESSPGGGEGGGEEGGAHIGDQRHSVVAALIGHTLGPRLPGDHPPPPLPTDGSVFGISRERLCLHFLTG